MLENLGLQNIKIRFIPATLAYNLYLSKKKMGIEELKLCWIGRMWMEEILDICGTEFEKIYEDIKKRFEYPQTTG